MIDALSESMRQRIINGEKACLERLTTTGLLQRTAHRTAIADAVGSKRLSRMHELIMGEVRLTMGQVQAHRTTDPRTVATEHAATFAVIEACDATAAADHLSAHLGAALDRLVARSTRDERAQEPPRARSSKLWIDPSRDSSPRSILPEVPDRKRWSTAR